MHRQVSEIVIHFIGAGNQLTKKTSKTSYEALMVKMHSFHFDDIHIFPFWEIKPVYLRRMILLKWNENTFVSVTQIKWLI